MERPNNKKPKKKIRHNSQSPFVKDTTLFTYIYFFLGTIGELVLLPFKFFILKINTLKELNKRNKLLTTDKKNLTPSVTPKTKIHTFHLSRTSAVKYVAKILLRQVRVEIAMMRLSTKWRLSHLPKISSISLPKIRVRLPRPRKPSSLLITFIRSLTLVLLGCFVMLLIVLCIETMTFLHTLPNPRLLTTRDIPMTTKILDRNGILLYELFVDQNRTLVPLSNIPDAVKKATIAIEDREFYTHHGFSIRGIVRAARETLIKGNIQGGSTITQQLIKSALLTSEVTMERKIKELILAFWTEQLYTKDQILEMYLNQVPYGGTSWGIESASQTFFGKSVTDLSLAEATFLAGLPAAPTEYSPFGSNKEKAYIRQHEVLRRMVEERYITQEESTQAQQQTLLFTNPLIPIRAPHFVLYTRDYLIKRYGERQILQGGLTIRTTLDAQVQDKVQQIVSTEIKKLKPLNVGNGAVLVTDPKTGGIIAMVGSKDYFDVKEEGNVNVTTAFRQPGSSIKVVTYVAALERGMTAASLLDDSPVEYKIPGQPSYAPVNYDGRWHGLVPLRYALGNSYNIPAVKTLDRIGIMTMIEKGREMGIDTWTDPSRFGLSLTLGGGEVTMMDMAEVYGSLANEGKRIDLSPISEITDFKGNIIQKGNTMLPIQAVSPEISWIMSNILSDNSARTQAFGPNSNLVIPEKTVSVKTGTTNEKRDNWTIGYTPSFVVTVWVGNNDNTPMHPFLTSGVTGASPIWQQIMKELLVNKTDEVPKRPDTIISLPCYFGKPEYFIKGTEPKNGRCQAIPTITPSPSP